MPPALFRLPHIFSNDLQSAPMFSRVCVSVLVCFRPVCPSGDGGVLEWCSSWSPSDPLPYSTWPFIYSASWEGEQSDAAASAVPERGALYARRL